MKYQFNRTVEAEEIYNYLRFFDPEESVQLFTEIL